MWGFRTFGSHLTVPLIDESGLTYLLSAFDHTARFSFVGVRLNFAVDGSPSEVIILGFEFDSLLLKRGKVIFARDLVIQFELMLALQPCDNPFVVNVLLDGV